MVLGKLFLERIVVELEFEVPALAYEMKREKQRTKLVRRRGRGSTSKLMKRKLCEYDFNEWKGTLL